MTKTIKLLCLPFAGGYASIYLAWNQFIDPAIEVMPIELAGRGTRLREPLYKDLKAAVNDIYRQIKKDLDAGPYAIFGHSLGGLLAYELYYKIRFHGHRTPYALFLSAENPPHCKRNNYKHLMSKEELKQQLMEMGGTSTDLFRDEELFDMFLPVFYSDFKMAEVYEHKVRKQTIDCELVILSGNDDDVAPLAKMMEWQTYGHKGFQAYEFHGKHLFINDQPDAIVQVINQHLTAYLAKK